MASAVSAVAICVEATPFGAGLEVWAAPAAREAAAAWQQT